MAQLDKLEHALDDVLRKKAPVQLPPAARIWIARNLWWLALISGLCLLWSALTLWQAGHTVDRFAEMYANWAGQPYVHHLGLFYYLSLLAIGATGVLTLVATANLKDMRRSGWQLLFYAALTNVLAAVCMLFSEYGGVGRFFGALIGAGIGGWFLFQVRERFAAGATAPLHMATRQDEVHTVDDNLPEVEAGPASPLHPSGPSTKGGHKKTNDGRGHTDVEK